MDVMRLFSRIAVVLTALLAMQAVAGAARVEFTDALPVEGDLVLGVYAGGALDRYGADVDDRSGGRLSQAMAAGGFEAEIGEMLLVPGVTEAGLGQVLLLGLGDREEPRTDFEWQELGGNAIQSAVGAPGDTLTLAFEVPHNTAANIAYGAVLGSYAFDKYITDEERKKSPSLVTVVSDRAEQTRELYRRELMPIADAIELTRDVSNEPPNVIYPESFVELWQDHLEGADNVRVRVFDEKDMRKMGMGAIYGVGRGSERPPRMMIAEYMGGEKGEPPVVIVGKGITFDTGGISIKPWKNMWDMKFDMAGAASVMGTVYALAGREARVNVVAIAALAENMPGGAAQRPGDIVTTFSGKTIEVRHTDAEGRLVLADAIAYGEETYEPVLLVDLATLTGSAIGALGKDYAALFTRDEDLVADLLAAGEASGDKLWRLPLNEGHFEAMQSEVADVVNIAGAGPGASTAAAFVGSFVGEETPWVHLDIAGVAWNEKPTALKASPGSTGYGVALLNSYIRARFEEK